MTWLYMIVSLLRQINAKLSEIIKILREPEDFTTEDQKVLDGTKAITAATKAVSEAKDRIPH